MQAYATPKKIICLSVKAAHVLAFCAKAYTMVDTLTLMRLGQYIIPDEFCFVVATQRSELATIGSKEVVGGSELTVSGSKTAIA